MKKIFLWLLLVLAAATFWSCSDDSSTEPALNTPTAILSISSNSLTFGNVENSSVSAEQIFTVSGSILTSSVTVKASNGFKVSVTTGSGFADSVVINSTNGTLAASTVYTRFQPTAAQTYNGSIVVKATGVNKVVSVSGIGITNINNNMVLVEGGTFQMGDEIGDLASNSRPVHSVTLSSFHIGKYEVTQAEWLAMMGTNPSNHTGDNNRPVEVVSWYDVLVYCNKRSVAEGLIAAYTINGTTNPANWGSVPTEADTIGSYKWNNVVCNWLSNGYRLPTESEWEYAARGGKYSHNYLYSGSNNISDIAWYYSNGVEQTHPVGLKTANELGLYDMTGNVWEWTWDLNGYYSSSSQTNPHGNTAYSTDRTTRGGSCNYYAEECRVAGRCNVFPDFKRYDIGFRLARTSLTKKMHY